MDRSSFNGRIALITGASGGIVQALARRLAAGGAVLGLGYAAHVRAPKRGSGNHLGRRQGDRGRRRPASPVGPPVNSCQPSEVADLAAAILANAYLTNQVISLDVGIYPRVDTERRPP